MRRACDYSSLYLYWCHNNNIFQKMSKLLLLLCVLSISGTCDAYKVLVVFPQPGRSHSILGYKIVKLLLEAGHEVTYITPFIENNTNPKLRQIDVSSNADLFPKDMLSIKMLMENKIDMEYHVGSYLMTLLHVKTIENPNVQKLLQDPTEKFDVIIIEWLLSEICVSYAAIFDAPLIWLGSTEPHWQILRLIDEQLSPAYNGDAISANTAPFNFLQRVDELWLQIKTNFFMYTYLDNAEREEYERLVAPIIRKRGRQPPAYDEVKYNASLILGNSHVSLGQATKLPQNFKPIGGYHIDHNVPPLPEDLQKLFDNAPNGVIYFSMGSNLKSKDLPDELKKDILKVFSGLKQTVLWKFEDQFDDLPKNVHIVKWAPQPSILSHPNYLFFISHGGLLSTTEAVHFGVPIIGIPVFADQFLNVNRAVNKGFAKRVDLSYTMASELKVAIQDMLSDPSYRKKAKELSLVYHDRPVRPSVELVHWVEHVVKTRGAPHLRSPALLVPWYQKIYLDLAALIILAVILVKVFYVVLINLYLGANIIR